MNKVVAALRLLALDLQVLRVPAIATVAAGAVVALLAVFGLHFTPAAVTSWLVIVGTVAGVIDKLLSGQAAAAAALKKREQKQKQKQQKSANDG